VSPKAIAMGLAAGRFAIGLGLLAVPGKAGGGWIGADAFRPATQTMVRGLGGRDIAIGAGTLLALRAEENMTPWLAAGALSDAADFVGTVAARDHIPNSKWAPSMAIITVSVIAHTALATVLAD
jgi:hypothetical protein